MADRAERQRDVAGEGADIGALGDMGAEGDGGEPPCPDLWPFRLLSLDGESMDGDGAGLHLHILPLAGEVVGAPAVDQDGAVGGGRLFEGAGEGGQYGAEEGRGGEEGG